MSRRCYKKLILAAGLFLFLLAGSAEAVKFSDMANFYVDSNFDASGRTQVSAALVKTTNNIYFYIEKSWWDSKTPAGQEEILTGLDALSQEFDNKIYPTLTSVFGSEWRPGVDGDSRITILFEPMNSNEGGYFRTIDEYVKLQLPESNEREMLYLSTDLLGSQQAKVILAHEFMHLITFNQKNKILKIDEEVWLNEARADYSSTVLGYDDVYQGSNLQGRVRDFVENPSDSITEWTGSKYDYASNSLFMHYMADHYSIDILADSLKSQHVGIDSINYALDKNGFTQNFSQIFTDWTIASILNDCSINSKYCYLNQNLKNLRLSPSINFLPVTGNVSLSVTNVTKNWAGNWLKFIGGNGALSLDFSSLKGLTFKVPYIIEDSAGSKAVKFLDMGVGQKGQINIEKFGTDYKSLIIIPTLQSQIYRTDGLEPTYPFTYSVEITGSGPSGQDSLIKQLLDQIEYLKNQIAELQSHIGGGSQTQCLAITNNLYVGLSGSSQVRCLQEFLKKQGQSIYPEALVTGYFGSLTKSAVIRFQEKYASEILYPLGLSSGTGYVGSSTRNKINQLLGS